MRRILLVKTSSLGDVVHNLPAVSDLRAQFPELEIDSLIPASLQRSQPAELPEVYEVDVIRHYTALSRRNFGIASIMPEAHHVVEVVGRFVRAHRTFVKPARHQTNDWRVSRRTRARTERLARRIDR